MLAGLLPPLRGKAEIARGPGRAAARRANFRPPVTFAPPETQ
jgi:hypothetical protein